MRYRTLITTATIIMGLTTTYILSQVGTHEVETHPIEVKMIDTKPPRIDTKKGDISITIDFKNLTDEQIIKMYETFAVVESNPPKQNYRRESIYQMTLEMVLDMKGFPYTIRYDNGDFKPWLETTPEKYIIHKPIDNHSN